jgi:hypothetical protein
MQKRDKLISDLQSILLSLYFTYEEMDDIETKKRLVDILLDVVDEEILKSFVYEEPRYEVAQYLINEVDKRFGSEKR